MSKPFARRSETPTVMVEASGTTVSNVPGTTWAGNAFMNSPAQ
jgi:hypothetical protein